MSVITTIFATALVPVFFGLGLGYYSGWRGQIDNRNVSALNTTLMHYILPCSLFLAVGKTAPTILRSQFSILAVLALAMLILFVLVFMLERKVFRKTLSESSVQALTVSFSNNVAVGLPVLSCLFAAAGLLAVASAIIAGVLVISPITLVMLECGAAGEERSKSLMRRVGPAVLTSLRRPVIFAPLCALLLPLTGHTLPVVAVQALDLVGKAAIGVALFLTGLILSAKRMRLTSGVLCGVFLKNIGQPVLTFLLILLFRQHGDLAREEFVLAAIPAGFFGTVFGARYGVDSQDASSTLVLSTIASIATVPLAIAISAYLP